MADILPAEGVKARILNIRPAPEGTPLDAANSEWVEVRAATDIDHANCYVQLLTARFLSTRPAREGTPLAAANSEWVEIRVEADSDLANWRVQHLRAQWTEGVARAVEWEWG